MMQIGQTKLLNVTRYHLNCMCDKAHRFSPDPLKTGTEPIYILFLPSCDRLRAKRD